MLSIVEPHLPRSGYFWRNQAGALGSPLFFTIWGIYWDILGLFLSQVGIWYDDMIWRPQLWWNIITYHHWWQPFVSWNCTPKIPKHSIPLGSSCKSSFFLCPGSARCCAPVTLSSKTSAVLNTARQRLEAMLLEKSHAAHNEGLGEAERGCS